MSRTRRLWVVLAANLALVAGLLAVGATAHSIGVWAEGADYLADAAAIGVSLLAVHLAARPPSPRRPRAYPKATSYAALVNAGWLFVLSALLAAGATRRLLAGVPEVHGLPVLGASAVAAVVMIASALLLAGDDDGDEGGAADEGGALNMHAVLLDTAADAAAAAGVAVAGAVIWVAHGWYWLDPAVALLVALVVGYHSARLLVRIRAALAAAPAP